MFAFAHFLACSNRGCTLSHLGPLRNVITLGRFCIQSYVDLTSQFFAQVLHMDRNDYYGGETASLNLKQVITDLGWIGAFKSFEKCTSADLIQAP